MSKVFQRIFSSPVLTRERVRLAYAVAVATDVLQLALGPFGWAFADELLDVVGMVLTWRVIGFHPLLLPTFVLEFLPLADMLPTWTGCVAIVVALRKRQQAIVLPPPGPFVRPRCLKPFLGHRSRGSQLPFAGTAEVGRPASQDGSLSTSRCRGNLVLASDTPASARINRSNCGRAACEIITPEGPPLAAAEAALRRLPVCCPRGRFWRSRCQAETQVQG